MPLRTTALENCICTALFGQHTEDDNNHKALWYTHLHETVISTLVAGMAAVSGSNSPIDAIFTKLFIVELRLISDIFAQV